MIVDFFNRITVGLQNPKTYILANLGNKYEIINLALKYLEKNEFNNCLDTLSRIDGELLLKTTSDLADYYYFCFDLYYYLSNDLISSISQYFAHKQYNFKWRIIKNAMRDNLIKESYIVEALSLVAISEDNESDFLTFIFNNIKDKYVLYTILANKSRDLKKTLTYGFKNGYLSLGNLLMMARIDIKFAKVLVLLLQDKEFNKSISENELLNTCSDLGNDVSDVRYECGLISLQLGNLEKASILLSSVPKDSANYARAMKEYGDILYTNSNNSTLAANYYKKAYEAGDNDAKILCAASHMKALGKNPSISDVYHAANDQLVTQTFPQKNSISYESFKKAHRAYLNNKGLFSFQSKATLKVIEKASKTFITGEKRFRIIKKYFENKSNIGRDFRSYLQAHLGYMFSVKNIQQKEDSNLLNKQYEDRLITNLKQS